MARNPLKGPLKFSDTDLEANRSGYMSKEQRLRLRRQQQERFRDLRISALGVIAGSAFGILVTALFRLNVCIIVAICLLDLGLGVWAAALVQKWRRLDADLYKGDVSTASGRVLLDVQPEGEVGVKCVLKIQGLRFEISKDAMLAFHNEDVYRVYYLPNTKTVLSAEPAASQEPA
jgi:hypothetical protein